MNQQDRSALVAEDNRALSRVIGFSLRKAGFNVSVAQDGEEAWEILQRERFDLIVTDYQMPRLTGVELATRVRQHESHQHVPIVLLTAKALELDAEELNEQHGVSAVLTKPFSPSGLAELVNRLTLQPV